ncbi:uncharacterized protein LOC110973116 [Acanthaster planci]|uniref:Uncharacterized protein LOC110973116 n=1 Tax=Acanthaster planci TaxID=133434 RepID=A0A8B7XHC9_ACAPL|nr:uncharacterized protein LOC110973116 [Acanthaster planci]XP_022079346.1 uncharacterized protein LOC110973116 [Acanthaster planci]
MKYCAVPTCSNTSYHYYKWRSGRCSIHDCNYGTGPCQCDPPLRFFPFPTKRDKPGRERWTKLINRKNPSGETWQPDPAGRSSVCSEHFPDGQPTKQNPDPILKLGYDPPADLIRPRSPPRKKQKAVSESEPGKSWSVPLPTTEPQVLTTCLHSSSQQHQVPGTGKTMTAIIPQTKPRPRPPKRMCIACQSISENGRHILSNKGRLDLQECLRQYLNLEVEQGWMCSNCVRQVKTIVKKVNTFRSSVLAGECNRVFKVSPVAKRTGVAQIRSQPDTNSEHPSGEAICKCSRLLKSMLSKQNVGEPLEKTRIKVIFPRQTKADTPESETESSEDFQDSSSSEEDFCENPRTRTSSAQSDKNEEVHVFPETSGPNSTPASLLLETCNQSPTESEKHLPNQNNQDSEPPAISSDTVHSTNSQLQTILPRQDSSSSDSSPMPVSSAGSLQDASIMFCIQPTTSSSGSSITSPSIQIAASASDEFIYTKTLNELAKFIARKPHQEHDYAQ